MKVIFDSEMPQQASQPQVSVATSRPTPRKSRVQLQPIAASTRLFHAFYA